MQRMSLVVDLLCNKIGLLLNMILFCKLLFLYFNILLSSCSFKNYLQHFFQIYQSWVQHFFQIRQSWVKTTEVDKKKVGLLHFAPDWKLQFEQ